MDVSEPSCVIQRLFRALGVVGVAKVGQCPWWWPVPRCAARVGGLGSLALQTGHPAAPQLSVKGFGFASAGTLLNLSVSDHGRSDSLLLSWDEPEGGVEGYSLALSSLGSGTPLQNGSAGPNITSFWFHGLTPGTHYEIEVTAMLACTETTRQTVTAQTSKGFPRDCRVKGSQCSYQWSSHCFGGCEVQVCVESHEFMGRSGLSSLPQVSGSFPGPQTPRGHSLIHVEGGSCPCTLHGQGSRCTFSCNNIANDGPAYDVDCREPRSGKCHAWRSRKSYKEVAFTPRFWCISQSLVHPPSLALCHPWLMPRMGGRAGEPTAQVRMEALACMSPEDP